MIEQGMSGAEKTQGEERRCRCFGRLKPATIILQPMHANMILVQSSIGKR